MAFLCLGYPAFAVCPIYGGSCSYEDDNSSLQEKYLPDNIQNKQKPDAFRPRYVVPYNDALINTETDSQVGINEHNKYRSSCQFGICLPSGNNSFSGGMK